MGVLINVKIAGMNEALNAMKLRQINARNVDKLAIQRVALLLRDTMVRFAGAGHPEHPNVQTGRLKSSIRYTLEEGTPAKAKVGSDAPYAPFVEFGHMQTPGRFVPDLGKRLVASFVKPYPFVRPAITQVFDGGQALTLVKNTVKEAIA